MSEADYSLKLQHRGFYSTSALRTSPYIHQFKGITKSDLGFIGVLSHLLVC